MASFQPEKSRTVQAGPYPVSVEGTADAFELDLWTERLEEGVELVHLRLAVRPAERLAGPAAQPGVYRLAWSHPLVDVQAYWRPGLDRSRALPADWVGTYTTQSTNNAPCGCLFNQQGTNRHTFALSDALNPVVINAGVNEETATFRFVLTLFSTPTAPFQEYHLTLRLDHRPLPYYRSLDQVRQWWEDLPGFEPAAVPAAALEPMYSTWYSFHQPMTAAAIEEQCRLAAGYGCRAVIVDDGWQTSNNERGYAYCGDWEVWPAKFPDMARHVAAVHRLGFKFILWYAVPFVGPRSRNFRRFEGHYLGYLETFDAWALDPRFPAVREFLIETYETALREWDVDGFKLDFVQHFVQPSGKLPGGAADYASVPLAVDRLLTDIMDRLRRLKPDIMIEFRQTYTGPLMRKYGNMFRAGDCPADSLNNRVRTLDVRLLAGASAVHSDMLMWHPDEAAERAALQIINVLFAVPQISVRLDALPPDQARMLAFWLSFWRANRRLLLEGELKPGLPDYYYPQVEVALDGERLVAVYNPATVARPSAPAARLTIINGTLEDGLPVDPGNQTGRFELTVQNCAGEVTARRTIELTGDLVRLEIPPAGLATLTPANFV